MMNQLTTAYPTCPLRSPQVARSSQVKKRYHETYLRAKVYVNITQHLRIGAVGAKCGRPREKEKRRGGRAGRYDDEALWLAANWTDPKDRVEPLEPQGGSLAQWARIRAVQACKQAAVKK